MIEIGFYPRGCMGVLMTRVKRKCEQSPRSTGGFLENAVGYGESVR
jgi:hypothetical protein